MLGLLLCPVKSTVSNIICTRGGQHADWTADYRLYSKARAIAGNLSSTGDLLRLLRIETWAGVLRPATFYHFVSNAPPDTNAQKPMPDLPAVLFNVA